MPIGRSSSLRAGVFMRLIDPTILTECIAVSPTVSSTAVGLGIFLWLTGWRWHRFWLALGLTVSAGMVGLVGGRGGDQALAVALLLAVAAGVMAMELGRLLAFLAGGATLCLGVKAVLPTAQELLVVFLLGGLVGVLLYRIYFMLMTSFVGVLLCWHAGLGLIGKYLYPDIATWVTAKAVLLNGAVLGATLLGVMSQILVERRAKAAGGGKGKDGKSSGGGGPLLKWPDWLKFKRKAA